MQNLLISCITILSKFCIVVAWVYKRLSRLEPNFHRLYWPPILLEGLHTPGQINPDAKFIRGFDELDAYFTKLCGSDWMNQEWARYWRGQHQESKTDDVRDLKYEKQNRVKPLANTGPRRDRELIKRLCFEYLSSNQGTKISSYKLARWLKSEHDIVVNQKTTWTIIKRYQNAKKE